MRQGRDRGRGGGGGEEGGGGGGIFIMSDVNSTWRRGRGWSSDPTPVVVLSFQEDTGPTIEIPSNSSLHSTSQEKQTDMLLPISHLTIVGKFQSAAQARRR